MPDKHIAICHLGARPRRAAGLALQDDIGCLTVPLAQDPVTTRGKAVSAKGVLGTYNENQESHP